MAGLGGKGARGYHGGCVGDIVEAVIGTQTGVGGEVAFFCCVGVEVERVGEILIGMCDDLIWSRCMCDFSLSELVEIQLVEIVRRLADTGVER